MTSYARIVITVVISFAAALSSTASAALFIAAHPDDIEYLMNKNAQNDVKNNYPTVFILVTAGDAGRGVGALGNTKNIPYYRARLRAHELCVRFWQGLNPDVAPPLPTYSIKVVKGKKIESISMGSVVMYNLNLPDNGSLVQLADGKILSVKSISPINTYTLRELKDVIREIMRINNPATPMINVNTHDPDQGWNPNDHHDHISTGAIVAAAITELPGYRCANLVFHKGYAIGGYALTYTQEEFDIHVATIGVLNSGLVENGNESTWDPFHNNFFGKIDYRAVFGTGQCAF